MMGMTSGGSTQTDRQTIREVSECISRVLCGGEMEKNKTDRRDGVEKTH